MADGRLDHFFGTQEVGAHSNLEGRFRYAVVFDDAITTVNAMEGHVQNLRKGMLGSLRVHTLGSNSTGC